MKAWKGKMYFSYLTALVPSHTLLPHPNGIVTTLRGSDFRREKRLRKASRMIMRQTLRSR